MSVVQASAIAYAAAYIEVREDLRTSEAAGVDDIFFEAAGVDNETLTIKPPKKAVLQGFQLDYA